MKASRRDVYKAIDTERAYQDIKWNEGTTASGGKHSLTEWLVYLEDYINEAKHIASRQPDPIANEKVLDIMRKIGGMAVSAMEQHGAPLRHFSEAVVDESWQSAYVRLNRERAAKL